MKSISVTLQLLSGNDVQLTLPPNCSNSQASKLISQALSISGAAANDLVLVDTLSGKRVLLSSLRPSSPSSPPRSPSSAPAAAAAGPELGGERQHERDGEPLFADGAVVLALPAPRLPPERVRRRNVATAAGGEAAARGHNGEGGGGIENDSDSDDDQDAPLLYRPPANKLARRLAEGARRRGLLPESVLAVLVRIPRNFWLFLLLWPLGAKVSSLYSLGPLFILLSIVVAIFCNLGERKPGEASAYSVFNEGFRSLLGEFRAEAIDDGLRRGNL